MKRVLPILFLLLQCALWGQEEISIAIVSDRPPDNTFESTYEDLVESEIRVLLQLRYPITFKRYYPQSAQEGFQFGLDQAYDENDIVVAIGTGSSAVAAAMDSHSKPTVASLILDVDLQGLQKTAEGTSGMDNFTYLESPFDIERDLNLLKSISSFDHLLVLSEAQSIGEDPFIEQLFVNYLKDNSITVESIHYEDDLQTIIEQHSDKKIAAFLLPFIGNEHDEIEDHLDILNNNKIPSSALFGEDYISHGAFVAYESEDNLQKLSRRIAINVMKIIEGQNPSDLSVEMQSFDENLLINMETARRIGIYPDFDMMADATLVNLEKSSPEDPLSLHAAIGLALKENLEIKIQNTDVGISETDIELSKADTRPQADISSSLQTQDEISTLANQGALGQTNWLAGISASQLIYSEPVLANIAIQKMLKASEEQELRLTQLDIILEVANAYINILYAKSNLNIQQENVKRNKENYDNVKAKDAIGYSGASDINRWEAELANANIELNNAYATLRQTKFVLNQLLNRPINFTFDIADISLESSMLLITDSNNELVNNYGQLEQFANFLVGFAKDQLPELAQIDLAIDVQERLLLSRKRAFYLPNIALSGSANRVLGKYNVPSSLNSFDNVTTWDIGIGISYPLLQGKKRKNEMLQSQLNIEQLGYSKNNLENQLELRIRSNMEAVGASYSQMQLSKTAADASQKNYTIVQNAYQEGQTNIVTLIDAQNNALFSELSAINAVYTFILDFLTLERSIGFYNFLASQEERISFFESATQYITQK